jgi:hypothetical protein
MTARPEHDKMRRLQQVSQTIGDFLTWADENELRLCVIDPRGLWMPCLSSYEKLFAQYYGLDLEALAAEKRAMLEQMKATP